MKPFPFQSDRTHVFPFILPAIALFFLFKDILIRGHLLFGSDFIALYLGMKQFLFDEIHIHHSIPFWNPFIFSGMPFWAHFESTIFYPLDFLFLILSPERAFGYTLFIHLALASMFMAFLCRALGIGPSGSLIGASLFGLNCFVMATVFDGQMFRIQAYTWIPLIIHLTLRALEKKKALFHASMAGLIWGIQLLAGSPQDAFYTLIAVALLLVCLLKHPFRQMRHNLRLGRMLVLLFLVGSGLAAIQLIPAFEFAGLSARAQFKAYELLSLGSYPPKALITGLMPHFFGHYYKGDFWVSGVPWSVPLYNLYVGVIPLFLLLFINYRTMKHNQSLTFAILLAILSLALALGSHAPLYKLVSLLPGFDKIRAPAKIIMLWVFAMGLLAAKGMDDLFHHSGKSFLWRLTLSSSVCLLFLLLDIVFFLHRPLILSIFSPLILGEAIPARMADAQNIIVGQFHRLLLWSLLFSLLLLLWKRRLISQNLTILFLWLALIIDLGSANWGALRQGDEIYQWVKETKVELDRSIGRDNEPYRVGSYDYGMGPNIEMAMSYQTVGGYTPLFLHRYYEYINHYTDGTLPEGWVCFFYGRHERAKMMDLLNLKYEISHSEKTTLLRESYLPRAMVVTGYSLLPKKKILDTLTSPGFDPRKTLLFEEEDHLTSLSSPDKTGETPAGEARLVSYRPDMVTVDVRSSSRGFLFLSEIFYPGWKALVDGRPERILRANYLFRAIPLPEGQHTVQLVFDPLSIKVGIAVSLITLLALCFICILRIRSRVA